MGTKPKLKEEDVPPEEDLFRNWNNIPEGFDPLAGIDVSGLTSRRKKASLTSAQDHTARPTEQLPAKRTDQQQTQQPCLPPESMTREPTNLPTYQPKHQAPMVPTGEPTHQRTDEPTGKPTEQGTHEPTDSPTNRQTYRGCSGLEEFFTDRQLKVVNVLLNVDGRFTNKAYISGVTGMSQGAVKTVIERLKTLGILKSTPGRVGKTNGFWVTMKYAVIQALTGTALQAPTQPTHGPTHQPIQVLTGEQPHQATQVPTSQPTELPTDRRTALLTARPPDMPPANPSLDRQIEKNLSIKTEEGTAETGASAFPEIYNISPDMFGVQFPRLLALGFTQDSMRQVFHERNKIGAKTPYMLQSLLYAEWELENGKALDKDGRPIESGGFFYKALLRGAYRVPVGYKSPEDLELEALEAAEKARQERAKKISEMRQETAYLEWENSLEPEEREKILNDRNLFPKPGTSLLRTYYERRILNSSDNRSHQL